MSERPSHGIQYVYVILAIVLLLAGITLLVFGGNNVAAQAGGLLNVIFAMFIFVILRFAKIEQRLKELEQR